eukprot:1391509-Prymnesium_polylepis.1
METKRDLTGHRSRRRQCSKLGHPRCTWRTRARGECPRGDGRERPGPPTPLPPEGPPARQPTPYLSLIHI